MSIVISGIQQMGIGVADVYEAWRWYRIHFGFDVSIFDEAARAELMLPYTGGEPQSRHAILAYNLKGGGGMEIWQYKSRTPRPPAFEPKLGDIGIFITKIKAPDIQKAYDFLKSKKVNILTEITKDPQGKEHFYVKDPYNNIFELVLFDDWYSKEAYPTGGIGGAVIGVTDIHKSKDFYDKILGYDTIVYEKEGIFEDFAGITGGEHKHKRMLLRHSEARKGHFSSVFGSSEIELIEVCDQEVRKIYEDRLWGELGYIHLCFDITGMKALEEKCNKHGIKFTVDSANSFDMGEAAGHFSYIEDPDGTLIEFVETHKIPIIKKLGWYMNLSKRNPEKPLPRFITNSLKFMRKKD